MVVEDDVEAPRHQSWSPAMCTSVGSGPKSRRKCFFSSTCRDVEGGSSKGLSLRHGTRGIVPSVAAHPSAASSCTLPMLMYRIFRDGRTRAKPGEFSPGRTCRANLPANFARIHPCQSPGRISRANFAPHSPVSFARANQSPGRSPGETPGRSPGRNRTVPHVACSARQQVELPILATRPKAGLVLELRHLGPSASGVRQEVSELATVPFSPGGVVLPWSKPRRRRNGLFPSARRGIRERGACPRAWV